MTRRMARGEAGFTLLELLVVFFIIGMLLALAVPRLFASTGPGALRAAAGDLADRLRFERSAAITRGTTAMVLIDPARHLVAADDGGALALPEGLALELSGPESELRADGGMSVRFFPDGSSTGARIGLARGSARLTVAVDWLTGRISVDDDAR